MESTLIENLPARRSRARSAFLALWALHRWLGVVFGIVILVISTSGALLVMHHELERFIHPERHSIAAPEATGVPAQIVPVLQMLQELAPAEFRPLRIEFGHGPTESAKCVFVSADRVTRWSAYVNPHTGEVLWHGADEETVSTWLLHLHMHFHAGRWGYVLGGTSAVALLLLTISGLYLHRDVWRAIFRHPLRVHLGWRVALGDLHRWVGVAGLYFLLVLSATGLWFSILIVPRHFKPPAPRYGTALDLAALTSPEKAIEETRRRFPGAEVFRVQLPPDSKAPLAVRVLHRDAPVWRKFSRIEFDAKSGAVLRVVDARAQAWREQLNSILAPLHFGFYGATLTKWIYVIGGFTPALLSMSGAAIWLLRRRGRPSPSAIDPE